MSINPVLSFNSCHVDFLRRPSAVLLHVCQRIPNTRMYSPVEDFVWDTTGGPSPEDLKQALSIGTSIPVDRLLLAKKLPDKYDWLIILSSAVVSQHCMKVFRTRSEPSKSFSP